MRKQIIVLVLFLLLGLLLRLYKISEIPLYGDELTIVQDAYSILHTGKDVTGKTFPLTFAMGAGRPAGYVYFSIPFVAVFGENALGVRGLSLVSGLGIILLVYLLGKRFFNEKTGFIAAFLTAISPWSINLSRGGFEAHFALFLALLGTELFFRAETKPGYYLGAALAWGVTIHTYPTYKLTLPLFILLLVLTSGGFKKLWGEKVRKDTLAALGILVAAGILAVSQTFWGASEQRFLSINIFSKGDPTKEGELIEKILTDRNLDTARALKDKFHNRPVEYSLALLENYLANFSSEFLFIRGDGNPRHNMTQSGIFYWSELVFILAGLIIAWGKTRKKALFLSIWILIVPPAAALVGPPHLLRSSFMFVPLALYSAAGLASLSKLKNNLSRVLLIALLGILFIEAVLMLERLYFVSPRKFANFWSYPAHKASQLALENKDKYDYVVLSNRIESVEYAYPVYAKVTAREVIAQNQELQSLAGLPFKKFGNVYIGNFYLGSEAEQFLGRLKGKYLLIDDYLTGLKGLPDSYSVNSPNDIPSLVVQEKKN